LLILKGRVNFAKQNLHNLHNLHHYKNENPIYKNKKIPEMINVIIAIYSICLLVWLYMRRATRLPKYKKENYGHIDNTELIIQRGLNPMTYTEKAMLALIEHD
jgi:hypothetical protein